MAPASAFYPTTEAGGKDVPSPSAPKREPRAGALLFRGKALKAYNARK